MATQPNIAREDAITAIRFPIGFLTIALFLTTVAFAWFGWVIFDSSRDAKTSRDQSTRMEELRGGIVHLDEVLTMSARMAATTGDPKWEERYRRFEPQLDAAIKETTKLGTARHDIKATTMTDEANIKLVEIENRAFALVRAGRREEAQAVLFSPEYETQKQIYAEGIMSFADQIRREVDERERQDKRIDFLSMIGALVVLAVSFAAWLSVLRGLQHWRTDLEQAVSERRQAEQSLRRAHDELEVRIAQRTTELGNTNQALQAEIIERKRTEEQLRVQATALDAAANAIVITDHNGTIQWVNRAFTALTGYTAPEVVGQNPRILKSGKQDEAFYRNLWQTISSGQVWSGELTNRRKDGSLYEDMMTITPLRNAGGVISRYIAIKQDISERKRTEEALQERAKLAALEADVGTALTRGGTLTEMLRLCSEAIVRHLDGAFARIWMLNEREKMLELQASAGMYTHLNGPHGRVPVGKFKIGLIAEERKPHLTNQVVGDPRVGDQEWAKREGMVAFAGYPLLVEDRLIGVVAMFARHTLTGTTLQSLASISNNIAVGIERKRAEVALRSSEELFRIAAETANDVIYEWDLKQGLEWLGKIDDLLGYEPGEFPRTLNGWAASVHPEDTERTMAAIQAHLEGRGPFAIEYRVRRKDGVYRWWSARGAVARTPDGKPIRWIGSITDITERKQAETVLRESQQIIEGILNAISVRVFWKDKNLVYLGCNAVFARDAGFADPKDIIGKDDYQMGWRDRAELYRAADRQVIESGGSRLLIEEPLTSPGGNTITILTSKIPLRNSTGEISGVLGTYLDITERKQAEAERDRLAAIVEASPDFIGYADPKTTQIQYINKHGRRMCGIGEDEDVGKLKISDVHPAWMNKLFAEVILPAAVRDGLWEGEGAFLHRNGCEIPVLMELLAHRGDNGEVDAFYTVSRDITERKRAQAELEDIHKQLVDASRRGGMAEIATNVLHNVGNVLNSVNVSTGLIVESVKKSRASSLARVVVLLKEHAHDLGAFITNDVRGKHVPAHLARLSEHLMADQKAIGSELDSLRRNVEHIKEIVATQQNYASFGGVKDMINVVNLVEDSLRINEGALSRHRVEIIREFENVPPMNVEKHKILQILVNLLRNAKHACQASDRADKRLTVRVANGDGRVKISVIDNGVGIPTENLTRIFNHGFTTRKDGHGFGLHSGALAAKEMGGSLTVHSDGPGQGAAFTLELPCPSEENSHE